MIAHCLLRATAGVVFTAIASTSVAGPDEELLREIMREHEASVAAALRAFARGNTSLATASLRSIAKTESYLAAMGVDADDPRLIGDLYTEQLARREGSLDAFIARVLAERLAQQSGYRARVGAATESYAKAINENRPDGGQ